MARRSATVRLFNATAFTLTKIDDGLDHGEYSEGSVPPDFILPGTVGYWQSETEALSLYGVEGFAKFTIQDGARTTAIGTPATRRFDTVYVGWKNPLTTTFGGAPEAYPRIEVADSRLLVPPSSPSVVSDFRIASTNQYGLEGDFWDDFATDAMTPLVAFPTMLFNPVSNPHALFELTVWQWRASSLLKAPADIPSTPWEAAGHASQVLGMASGPRGLFAATKGNRLIQREADVADADWKDIGDAHGAKRIAVSGNNLIVLTVDSELWMRPFDHSGEWARLGDAFTVRREVLPAPATVLGGVSGRSDSMATIETGEAPATSVSTLPSGRANLPAEAMEKRPVNLAALPEREAMRLGPRTTAAALTPGVPAAAALIDKVESIAAFDTMLFGTTTKGQLWSRPLTADGAAWEMVDTAPPALALTQMNGYLIALSAARNIWLREAANEPRIWFKANIDRLERSASLAASPTSAHAGQLFAGTRDNALWRAVAPSRIV